MVIRTGRWLTVLGSSHLGNSHTYTVWGTSIARSTTALVGSLFEAFVTCGGKRTRHVPVAPTTPVNRVVCF